VHAATVALLSIAGCQRDIGDLDGAFYDWSGRAMHCGVDLDDKGRISRHSIDTALDRARDRGEVAELYAHNPGSTVAVDTIEYVLAGARDRGLDFVTYADFADPDATPRAGLALSFDDTSVDAWYAQRALFQRYGARVTFFLSRYRNISDSQRAELKMLAGDGHDVEAHTVNHLRGPEYVEQYGLDAYLADEIVPSIDILEADGYNVRAFAYPFGARTGETDRAILDHVSVLRSVLFTWPEASSPCPL
jgi:peptidoglycan/xylan/chitin deacetylase (PgdA/CDA1 family)